MGHIIKTSMVAPEAFRIYIQDLVRIFGKQDVVARMLALDAALKTGRKPYNMGSLVNTLLRDPSHKYGRGVFEFFHAFMALPVPAKCTIPANVVPAKQVVGSAVVTTSNSMFENLVAIEVHKCIEKMLPELRLMLK